MEATTVRKIEGGEQYNHLFPKADMADKTVKRNANVEDTLQFIPKVVEQTKWQTKKIAALLKGNDVHETCSNIWHFVYRHIAYHKDKDGYEQIRSPARTWQDRQMGVDCDCYTVFISSILSNLQIEHQYRITKYGRDYYQHIYPIVPLPNGKYITVDCVVNQFNYEEPFTAKKDYKMNLQLLSGINDDDQFFKTIQNNSDDSYLYGNNWNENEMSGDLGRFRLKDVLKKGLHFINRINPGAVLLRNGVLASLKLNLFKVAQRMKWAYLTPEQAQQKGIIPEKYNQLVKVKDKLEKIFYGAGGKPDNFRHAMLKGKGNKHRDVALFGMDDVELLNLTPTTTVQELLGTEMYYSENVQGMEDFQGFGELGEPVSASAAIAAASGVMASISAIIKGIGNIFHPSSTESGTKDFDENEVSKPDEVTATETTTAVSEAAQLNSSNSNNALTTNSSTDNSGNDNSNNNGNNNNGNGQGFWDKNKKWIKPAASIAGGITLFTVAYLVLKPKPVPPIPHNNPPVLSGTTTPQKKKKQNKKQQKKKAVALM